MLFKSQEEKAYEAARRAEIGRFMEELKALPQFMSMGGGELLHGITGCVVRTNGSEVTLAWVEPYAGSDGRVVRLPDAQREKYLSLMKAQATALT